jgi:hypothetical protein
MLLIKIALYVFIGLLFVLFSLGLGYAIAEFLTALDPFYH